MPNLTYPAWVSDLSEPRIAQMFTRDTIARGRAYAEQGRVGHIAVGSGTGGSRSIPVGGAALDKATGILTDNLKQLASEKLEAANNSPS